MNGCSVSQVTLVITQSGDNISGSVNNGCVSETLTGTNSNGQIINAVLTINPLASTSGGYSNGNYNNGYNNGATGTQCIYGPGTLTISNNQISGSLNVQQTSQNAQMYGLCSQTLLSQVLNNNSCAKVALK